MKVENERGIIAHRPSFVKIRPFAARRETTSAIRMFIRMTLHALTFRLKAGSRVPRACHHSDDRSFLLARVCKLHLSPIDNFVCLGSSAGDRSLQQHSNYCDLNSNTFLHEAEIRSPRSNYQRARGEETLLYNTYLLQLLERSNFINTCIFFSRINIDFCLDKHNRVVLFV